METQSGGPRIGPQSINPSVPRPSRAPGVWLAPPAEMPESRSFWSQLNTPTLAQTDALGHVPVGGLSRPAGTLQRSMVLV